MDKKSTIDKIEVKKFDSLASEWWKPNGKFKTLHKFNPVRIKYIIDFSNKTLSKNIKSKRVLEGIKILDIGCGGGLLSEPLAKLGARVTGIDIAKKNIYTAKKHALKNKLKIDYQNTSLESFLKNSKNRKFDIILNMELVEHVKNVDYFISLCAKLLKPKGIMIVATLNRTLPSLILAKFAAEYILNWIPKGTHDWKKFIRPEELNDFFKSNGLQTLNTIGVKYNILSDSWENTSNKAINYMMACRKK